MVEDESLIDFKYLVKCGFNDKWILIILILSKHKKLKIKINIEI